MVVRLAGTLDGSVLMTLLSGDASANVWKRLIMRDNAVAALIEDYGPICGRESAGTDDNEATMPTRS